MAVLRRHNWLGQARVDVPHLRDVESSTAADFDLLAGRILANRQPLVVRGFNVVSTGSTLAERLQIHVADAVLIHYFATESGSIFQVPATRADELLSTTNPRVSGSFTPNQVNYVGVDVVRSTDATTSDVVMFLAADSLKEVAKEVPLARTLDYTVVISTTDFSSMPGVAPLAKVTTDGANHIVTLEDARTLFGRLGSGGSVPDAQHAYPWPAGRTEVGDPFSGGDKAIGSLKEWMDAAMTRVWEIGGGEHWYSATADRNVRMVRSGTAFVSTGEYFEWSGTHLHWRGLKFTFDNSTASLNEVKDQTTDSAGLTDLADGDCIYVDLDRTVNRSGGTALSAAKTTLALLGVGPTPGARYAIAWRVGSVVYTRDQPYNVGSALKLATTGAAGTVELSATDSASVTPARVATVDSVSRAAYATGLTRGSDFVAGAGDLQVGGINGEDHNVVLATTRDTDQVFIRGKGSLGHGVGVCTVEATPVLSGVTDLSTTAILRLRNYSPDLTALTDTFNFLADGSFAIRSSESAGLLSPLPPFRVKLFVLSTGTSPTKHDQLHVMWFDASTTMIAQSPAY